jgi:hypothetical protein
VWIEISEQFYHIVNVQTFLFVYSPICDGMPWRIWLRHCATSRKVAGSIPNGVIGIIDNISGCTALGSTLPLKETSTRNISWVVKAAGA